MEQELQMHAEQAVGEQAVSEQYFRELTLEEISEISGGLAIAGCFSA